MTVRVVLSDDQSLVRSGFRALLERGENITVVGEAADGLQAVTVTRDTLPDVVLMDIRMPELDGLEATRRIVADERLHSVRVIVLTTFDLDEYVFEALRAGAAGFLVKDTEAADLRKAVEVVASGEALLSPSVTRRLIAEFVSRPVANGPEARLLAELTEREREVMAAAALGLSNQDIGGRLHMSPDTARTHLSRAMSKLGARDRAQLVVIAYQAGLVTPR